MEHLQVHCKKQDPMGTLSEPCSGLSLYPFVRISLCGKGHGWVRSTKRSRRQLLCVFLDNLA